MVEVMQEPSAPPVGHLVVVITSPEKSGCSVWPQFCVLEAYVGGQLVGSRMLPVERDTKKLEQADKENWRLALRIPVGSNWPSLQSLDLLVERIDYDPWEPNQPLTCDGPHTSRFEAVIARARVPLMDALLVGDEDEDEEGRDMRKRRREAKEGRRPRLEGTLMFEETVTLRDWALPAKWPPAADVVVPSVRVGTVKVRMGLFEPWSP